MPSKKKIPGPNVGPTGRYAICPNSGEAHGLFAVQVVQGPKRLYCLCVCGVRWYYPPSAKLPKRSKKAVLEAGAIIPAELDTFQQQRR